MAYERITHVAIRVPNLQDAEEMYTTLFDTGVAFRETTVDGEWHTLVNGVDWDDAERAGYQPRMSFIRRDELFLALESTETKPDKPPEQQYHIGLGMGQMEIERFRQRAVETACEILSNQPGGLLVEDPFGYEWDISTNWKPRSTGERTGQWLDLQ